MRCQGCSHEVKSDFKYCPYCAQRLVQDLHNQFEALDPLPLLAEDPPLEVEDPAAAFYLSAAYGTDGDNELDEDGEENVYEEELIIDLEAPPSMGLDIESKKPLKRPATAQGADFQEKDPPPAYYVYQPEGSIPASTSPPFSTATTGREPPLQRGAPIVEPPPVIDYGGKGHRRSKKGEKAAKAAPAMKMEGKDLPELHYPEAVEEPKGCHETQAPRVSGRSPVSYEQEEDDVPYVSMQPEITRREEPVRRDTTPGIGIKVILIVVILLLGFLVSFVGYRFFSTPDPLHNFQFSSLFLSLVPQFIL